MEFRKTLGIQEGKDRVNEFTEVEVKSNDTSKLQFRHFYFILSKISVARKAEYYTTVFLYHEAFFNLIM